MVFYYFKSLGCPHALFLRDDYRDTYYLYFNGDYYGFAPLVISGDAYENMANTIFSKAGYNLTSTRIHRSITDASTALGMTIGSLMKDNPVALQNMHNSNKSVTSWHWVTITAADINVFNFTNSKLTYSSWGEINGGSHRGPYTFSEVWQGDASIVFFS